jgi:ketosteroid isomerase-like protein
VLELVRGIAPLSAAVLALAACGSPGGSSGGALPSELSQADVAGIRRTDSAFVAAANAGDVNGVVAVYSADAALLPPNLPPQRGHNAIRGFWGGLLKAYTITFQVSSEVIEGRGDLAYNVGQYRLTAVPKEKANPGIADEGKFVEILKKQPDGSWKYVVDIYNSNLAPAR